MLAINIESVTWMTRLVLPLMLAKKQGAVVNMSSASARMPLPLLAQVRARGRPRLRARLRPRLRARLRASLRVRPRLRLSVRASTPPPLPLLAQYSATKGYVENFTRSLAVEYAGKGVHF